MQVTVPDATRDIAQFVSRLSFQDLPRPVVEKAKEIVLDQVGVEMACAVLPTSKILYEYVEATRAPGNSTVLNYGLKTNPEYAAICNGTFGHGFEIDDYHLPAMSHPGCVAVPAMLAVGEELRSSGKDVLMGVALAAEIIIRIGLTCGQSMVMGRGFHATGVEGPIGGAAGAAKMMGLDEGRLLNALSIAGSHSSSTIEYGQTGGEVKRLHGGLGAMGGVRATILARIGLTAPPTILEGKRGLIQAFADEYDMTQLTSGLGEKFHILEMSVKPYCCCALIYSQIDAVAEIVSRAALQPKDIDEITVGTSKFTLSHCGSIGPEPKDINGAQFSSHFSLGLTVHKRSNDFKTYYEAMQTGFRDQAVLEVAHRVNMVVDDECDKNFPEWNIAKATVRTKAGKELRAVVRTAKGDKRSPVTRNELVTKFMGLATTVVPERRAAEIRDVILLLDGVKDIRALANLLVA